MKIVTSLACLSVQRGQAQAVDLNDLPASERIELLFMIWADLAARSILDSGELPIGIITAVCGAPIFAYIMIKKTYSFA